MARYKVCQKGIARTFQLCKPFLDFTALQNVVVGRVYGQVPSRNMKEAAEEARQILDQVGLAVQGRNAGQGPDRHAAQAAGACPGAGDPPDLLLLDELMAGLNLTEADEACKLITSIRDSEVTIIMVEHIVKAVTCISDRILVLNMGEKIAEGAPEDIVHDQRVIDVYLGKAHA